MQVERTEAVLVRLLAELVSVNATYRKLEYNSSSRHFVSYNKTCDQLKWPTEQSGFINTIKSVEIVIVFISPWTALAFFIKYLMILQQISDKTLMRFYMPSKIVVNVLCMLI